MRASFFKPGAATPYATIHNAISASPNPYPVIIGGLIEVTRGDLSGSATLRLSQPIPFEAGDWVRVWLDSDAETDPTYLGEVMGEPWEDGPGEILARGLSERLNSVRWVGVAKGTFSQFFTSVFNQSNMPTGITLGSLSSPANAKFEADVPFELVGDTIAAVLPAMEGRVIGINNAAQLISTDPTQTVLHRFPKSHSDRPPGSTDGYANCVRFRFEYPNGDEGYFEGQNLDEIAKRGQVWEEVQLPASVATSSYDGISTRTGLIETNYILGNTFLKESLNLSWGTSGNTFSLIPNLPTQSPARYTAPATDFPYVNVKNYRGWGRMGDIMINLDANIALPSKDDRVISVDLWMYLPVKPAGIAATDLISVVMSEPNYPFRMDRDEPGVTEGDALAYHVGVEFVGGAANPQTHPTAPDVYRVRLSNNKVGMIWPNIWISYRDAYTGYLNVYRGMASFHIGPNNGAANLAVNVTADKDRSSVQVVLQINGEGPVETKLNIPFLSDPPTGHPGDVLQSIRYAAIRTTPSIFKLYTPITIPLGSSVEIRTRSAEMVVDEVGIVPSDTTITAEEDRLRPNWPSEQYTQLRAAATRNVTTFLKRVESPAKDGAHRFAVTKDISAYGLSIGTRGEVVEIRVMFPDLSAFTGYTQGLLRYKIEPVREWIGEYHDLKRVPARGAAAFERPGKDDLDLDVQRVSYNLTQRRTYVTAGTPIPATDEDATVQAIESVKRIQRKAGQ